MSHGIDGLLIQGLCRKLRQFAQATSLELLSSGEYTTTGARGSIQGIMPSTSLVSLRGFHVPAAAGDQSIRSYTAPSPASRLIALSRPGHQLNASSSAWHDGWHSQQHQHHCYKSPAGVAAAASPAGRRQLASSAADAAQIKAEAVQEGRLVEFTHSKKQSLGIVLGAAPQAGSWKIEDVAGTVYDVREKDVVYVLPGGTFSAAQLQIIAAEAAAKEDECLKESLMALTWELSEPGAMYSVPEMAELLFRGATSASCSAAHRLLAGDRTYFKQVGRSPPVYIARQATEVASIKSRDEIKQAEEERKNKFLEAARAARAAPRAQRPTQADWQAGPHAAAVELLEAFALGRPPPGGEPGRALALNLLSGADEERTPQGAAHLLQSCGYWAPHIQLSLLSSGLTERFSHDLEAAATDLLMNPPEDLDADRREDLTDLVVYTIDDASTTEIDDGLSAERLPGGGIRIWVHVADPTRWIRPDDVLDIEARRRSKTLYLPTGMVPMFPMGLATGPFSLRAGEESCALTICCVLNENGELLPGSIQITPARILPTHRLTYDLVDEMLSECGEEDEPALHALACAAELRLKSRLSAGAIEISMPEVQVEVTDDNEETPEVKVQAAELLASPSRQLVAEMMILAGEACARMGGHMNVPMPYRGQPDPALPPQEDVEATPEGPCRMVLLRSCMPRSVTCAESPQRHYGLGLEAYAQVTSPIRRYGDLLAHWQLKAALRNEDPHFTAPHLTEVLAEVGATTQRVSRLERDAQSYWVAHYFKRSFAKDPLNSWSATFLGWFKQEAGLGRVLLDDLGLESLVKMASPARAGTRLRVRCSSADPLMGMYRLDEAADLGNSDNTNDSSTNGDNYRDGYEDGIAGVAA